jgi:hypothetical protein
MNDNPAPLDGSSRYNKRHWLPHAGEAFVEFGLADGRHWCLDLVNVSDGGLCFGLDDNGQPVLEVGSRIDAAVVRVGEIEISGSLLIAHATEQFGAGTLCGAEFKPSKKCDQHKLTTLIDQLEKLRDTSVFPGNPYHS